MATNRKICFRNGEIYHLFNRGLERKSIFTNRREFERAKKLIKFYRHKEIPLRFSQVLKQPEDIRTEILNKLFQSEKAVDILSYCLMPNHFHFLLKQNTEKGVSTFIANFTNAYTKYFNIKHQRIGPLFEGIFKGVYIENDEQLIHVSRYIHLNPIVSSLIQEDELNDYAWSSYREHLSLSEDEITQKDLVLGMFRSINNYQKFLTDQIDYAKKLGSIKHLVLE